MRRWPIRVEVTAAAVAVVVLVLIGAGIAVAVLQRNALTASIDQTLRLRADDIAALVETGGIPIELSQGAIEGFVQLVGPDGAVLAATSNLAGAGPVLDVTPAGADTIVTVSGIPVDDDAFRVLSRRLPTGTLHVGTTYDVVEEAASSLVSALAVIIPIAVVFLAGLVWWSVGTALRPVDDITSEVATIGSSDLHRRVPQPRGEDEIARLAATMNRMLERIENSVTRQQEFVADASHELRSPLTRIRTELDVALAGSAAEPTDTLRSLLEEVEQLQSLTDNLLFAARLDAGGDLLARVPVDLDHVVTRESESLRLAGRVSLDLGGVSAVQVMGDRGALARVVRNLVDNAGRHATGKVTVQVWEEGGRAHLTVADDGPGVPADRAGRIFERFGRVDEARSTDSGGTGLGLAIARDIAVRLGGELVLMNPGQAGAIFRLSLPAEKGDGS